MRNVTRVVLFAAVAFALGALGGILFEHYVGTGFVVDWSGLRHFMTVRSPRAATGRVEAPLAAVRGKRTMVALVFGQSNAANAGETAGGAHQGVFELYGGRLYRARDPLLGAEGDGGSVWLRLGEKAVTSGEFEAVVLVSFAVGATGIARWAPGGSLHQVLLERIDQALGTGLRFTHLLWHQGEADAESGTSETDYREKFLAMLAAIRARGVDAPIYVAVASRCGRIRGAAPIRSAQSALRNPASRILAGPDTDQLGPADRYNGCHFSTEGLDKAATLWWEAIRQGR